MSKFKKKKQQEHSSQINKTVFHLWNVARLGDGTERVINTKFTHIGFHKDIQQCILHHSVDYGAQLVTATKIKQQH